MKKSWVIGIIIVLIVLGVVGYLSLNSLDTIKNTQTSDTENQEGNTAESNAEKDKVVVNTVPAPGREDTPEMIIEVEGPGGCSGSECNQYCSSNPESCDAWCNENSDICNEVMASWGDDSDQRQNEDQPSEEEYMMQQGRQGDGVWEKNELSFYIKDEENVLTDEKRKIIQDTLLSTKESSGGFWGWNSALEELNSLYPDNIVPDKFTETDSEDSADFIIAVHSVKEFCCDFDGKPIRGVERSTVDENSAKLKSKVDMYNVVDIEKGLFGDMVRHELGHGLGIFEHVIDRNNDLMSLISPGSVIKKGNLNDLYLKYKNRDIQSVQGARERDQEYN